jgi:hypothetical protein
MIPSGSLLVAMVFSSAFGGFGLLITRRLDPVLVASAHCRRHI